MTDAPTSANMERITARAEQRAALGWRLQLVRAAIWEGAASGDAYSHVLLDAHDDVDLVVDRLCAAGPVSESLTGTFVITDPSMVRAVLVDPRFDMHDAEGIPANRQVMHLPGAGLDHADPVGSGWRRSLDLEAIADRAHRRLGHDLSRGGRVDLLAHSRQLGAEMAAEQAGVDADLLSAALPHLVPALDALMSPQRLIGAWNLLRAVSRLRVILRSAGRDPDADALTTSALVVWSSTVDRAVATVVEAALADREGALARGGPVESAAAAAEVLAADPPIRLHARVTQEPVELGDRTLSAGEQVTLVDRGGASPALAEAIGGAFASAASPLPVLAASIARVVVDGAGPERVMTVVRARRSPVTRRPAVATIEGRS